MFLLWPQIERVFQIINESLELVETSKKLDTRLSRCDVVISTAERLKELTYVGEWGLTRDPDELIAAMHKRKDRLILEATKEEVKKAWNKAEVAVTPKTKINTLSKVLLKIKEHRPSMSDPTPLNDVEQELIDSIHAIQLEAHLDAARKAEFKNQKKKALDEYYEALYFLRTDHIDDSLQKDQTESVEAKIRELGGEIQ